MINVNIIFDDIFDDADIIAVPDEIAPKIEEIGQEFHRWVQTTDDPDYWTVCNGKRCAVAESAGFIKWINMYYCRDLEKAYIVVQNTNYDPELKVVEF